MKLTVVVVFLLTAFFGSPGLSQSTNSGTSKKTPAKKKSRTSSKTVNRAPAAYRQSAPTPERYKEIQQALADKGYLKSAPSGVWDAESSAAMARFQNDRKLDPTGKLTAASLIALGLGPGTAPIPSAAPTANASETAIPPPAPAN